jgi:NitT/TauT family transport system substrate-binding protein
MIARGRFLAATGVAAALPSMVRAADPVTITVGIPPGYQGAIVDYAQQQGYFTAAGLDARIQVLNSGAIVATAVTGGSLDFGEVNVGSLASARLRGLPLRIVAPATLIPVGPSGDALLVSKGSPIRGAGDLGGKTIAIVALKTIQHAAFLEWLAKHGADPKSVKMFEMPLPDMAAALEAGRIDAAITVEPFTTKALPMVRAITLSVEDALPLPVLLFALCGNESWLAANAATAVKFAGAIRAAAVWGKAHEKECRALLATSMKLEPAVANAMYLPALTTSIEPGQLTPVIDVMLKYGFLDKPVKPAEMLWRPVR